MDEEVRSLVDKEQATDVALIALDGFNTGDYDAWATQWDQSLRDLPAGTPLTVLVDPVRPGRSVPWDLAALTPVRASRSTGRPGAQPGQMLGARTHNVQPLPC